MIAPLVAGWVTSVGEEVAVPSYRLYSTIRGSFFFTLLSPEGELLIQSLTYETLAQASSGIVECRQATPHPAQYHRLELAAQYYFTLFNLSEAQLGESQGFATLDGREAAIVKCQKFGPIAAVSDERSIGDRTPLLHLDDPPAP